MIILIRHVQNNNHNDSNNNNSDDNNNKPQALGISKKKRTPNTLIKMKYANLLTNN